MKSVHILDRYIYIYIYNWIHYTIYTYMVACIYSFILPTVQIITITTKFVLMLENFLPINLHLERETILETNLLTTRHRSSILVVLLSIHIHPSHSSQYKTLSKSENSLKASSPSKFIRYSFSISRRLSLNSHEPIDLQDAYLEVTWLAKRRVVEGLAAVCLSKTYILVHPNGLALSAIQKQKTQMANCSLIKGRRRNFSGNYPPPIVIILVSAAMNSSEEWPKSLSVSMPTQGYLALSGYRENRNVSPVPK